MRKIAKKICILAAAVCIAGIFTACSKPDTETQPPDTSAEETRTEAPETTAPAVETPEFSLITGKITAVTDTFSEVTLKAEGAEMTFNIENADVETTYELTPDTEITLAYKGVISGGDTSGASVLLVINAQADAGIETAEGIVTAQAMSSFTIQKADGSECSFLKNNCEGLNSGALGQAVDDKNGTGVNVRVTYVGASYDLGAVEGEGTNMNFPLKVEAVK